MLFENDLNNWNLFNARKSLVQKLKIALVKKEIGHSQNKSHSTQILQSPSNIHVKNMKNASISFINKQITKIVNKCKTTIKIGQNTRFLLDTGPKDF